MLYIDFSKEAGNVTLNLNGIYQKILLRGMNHVYYNKDGPSSTSTLQNNISTDVLLPSSGRNVEVVVLPSVLFGFVKSEVWRILVDSYQVILPVFTSPELLSTALDQTLVLNSGGVKEGF